jgi:hypothetical protein
VGYSTIHVLSLFLYEKATGLLCYRTFSGCDPKETDPKAIEVSNQAALTQEVFADQTQGNSGVNITTTGAWTSSITVIKQKIR